VALLPRLQTSRLYLRAPNHLGDGVMALAAVNALAECAKEAWVSSPAWGCELYRESRARWMPPDEVPEEAEVAVLLATSFRAAWKARHVPVRLGLATDHRRFLLTHALASPGRHRRDGYALLARAFGVSLDAEPQFRARPDERAEWTHLPVHVGLAPVSRSGAPVEWPFMGDLARRLTDPVVVYCGPGEQEAARARVPGVPVIGCSSLGTLAGALSRCRAFVGNDSGLSHFASAAGVPRVVVLFGSTDPRRTGAARALVLEGPDPGCRPCYRKSCDRGAPCLSGLPVESVLEALS
jgi:heptosyltransferase II